MASTNRLFECAIFGVLCFAAALKKFQRMEEPDGHAQISFNAGVIAESLGLSFEGLGNEAAAQWYFSRGCKESMPLSG